LDHPGKTKPYAVICIKAKYVSTIEQVGKSRVEAAIKRESLASSPGDDEDGFIVLFKALTSRI
jgi:hypothetical protein